MLILVLAILAILSPVLFGGRLAGLAQIPLRAVWIPVAALLAQVVIIEVVPGASRVVLEGVHLATYLAAGLFVLLNRRVPGLMIIAVGALLNGVTIALNDGTLPASEAAQRLAGIEPTPGEFINSAALPNPVLPLLGDIFAWPAPLPLANVFSLGDVVIVFGAFYGAQKICGSRLVKPLQEPLSEAAPDEIQTSGSSTVRTVSQESPPAPYAQSESTPLG